MLIIFPDRTNTAGFDLILKLKKCNFKLNHCQFSLIRFGLYENRINRTKSPILIIIFLALDVFLLVIYYYVLSHTSASIFNIC